MPESLYPALKALAEPNRLHILCDLGLECRPVTDIIAASGLSQTLVSFHLRILREAGLVRAERRGTFIYYCLADPELLRILGDLTAWLEARSRDDGNALPPTAKPMTDGNLAAIHGQEAT